jgi:transposase-like protein
VPPLALTNDQVTAVADEFARGTNRGALASRYGVHPNTITRALRRAGVPSRRGSPRALSAEQELEVVEDYAGGIATQSIATRFGVSAQHVSRIAFAHGVERRRSGLPGRRRRLDGADVNASLVVAYQRGASLRALARDYGVSSATIRQALVGAGVPRRPSHATARAV